MENPTSNTCNTIRDDNGGKFITAIKSLISDTNNAFWYINRGKTGAVLESIESNACQAIGNKN